MNEQYTTECKHEYDHVITVVSEDEKEYVKTRECKRCGYVCEISRNERIGSYKRPEMIT